MAEEQENVYGISVKFKPWEEKGYLVASLHMFECLGGDIAYGDLELWFPDTDDASELITEEQTGTIELSDNKENGITYKVPIFINSRSFFGNIMRLKFTCVSDKSFFTNRISLEHTDIGTAIKDLYPDKKRVDIRTESDVNNNIPIYQTDETNYSLLKRLALSYKRDSVFTFGFEGFMLKDTVGINSIGKNEKSFNFEFTGQLDMDNTEMYKLSYNQYLNANPFNPWEDKDVAATKKDYTDLQPINCRALIDYTTYSIMGTDYYQLQNNYNYNTNFVNSNYYTSFSITGVDMPTYKIGDIITYSRASQKSKYPFTKFLVASNEVFWSQNGASRLGPHGKQFEWNSKLLGIQPGEWSEEGKGNEGLL